MSATFVERTAAAIWLNDLIVSLGYEQPDVTLNGVYWTDRPGAGHDPEFIYDAHVSVSDLSMVTAGPEGNEEFAARLISATPSNLHRKDGRIYVSGETPGGLRWAIHCGTGVCEKVQVGTRKVMRPDPSAPMVEVEEPIYEVRCIDPLAVSA